MNNNAAATLLTLAALATDREVVVSRGELVEIGGSFRLPDVMSSSSARLREVGTTNKTRIGDYDAAINEQTAALLRVHTSNYRIVGFTDQPTLDELVTLGRRRGVPVIDDIGSGALIDFAQFGVSDEPLAAASISCGADVVLFSGDKLLGGPQCGIIVGRKNYIQRIARHPMMRAMRLDKAILAGLAATLRLYREPEIAQKRVPLLAMLGTSDENLRNRANRMAPQLATSSAIEAAEPLPDVTYLGGGSVPTQEISTWCVALTPSNRSVDVLASSLRTGEQPIFGRVQQNRLWFDLRTVLPQEDSLLIEAVQALEEPAEAPLKS